MGGIGSFVLNQEQRKNYDAYVNSSYVFEMTFSVNEMSFRWNVPSLTCLPIKCQPLKCIPI